MLTASHGFIRNFLFPKRLASPVTSSLLAKIAKANSEEQERLSNAKMKARAIQTAISTIGKFVITKKVSENDKIFGSVTATDVIKAIQMQTGQELDKKMRQSTSNCYLGDI